MSDNHCLRTRRDRREWERAVRRLARRAARHAGIDLTPAALLPLIALVVAPGAFALPVGGQVVNGDVSISTPAPNAMAITQGSQKGIVNWTGFSIGANETVNISQPSAQAVLLNRVTGGNASTIAGQLNANGKVFLVNPAGVLFARGASVNVGSIVASTLGISDSDFLAGKYRFVGAADARGRVVNNGSITAGERGTVALLGAQVDNGGTVSAKLGTVALGAGSDITLDFAGDGLTMLKVDGAAAQALASNSGVLAADGGQVLMSVQTADALAATVLNQTGTVRARSVTERNGRIVLDGGAAGVTDVSGGIDATGGAGSKGGAIDITGYQVAVTGNARIDASGSAGGGRVRVGGGAAGKETDIHNADAVWMGPGAAARADALDSGDGGHVVVYGENAARVYGTLTAKGGAAAGNGGLIETSARFIDVAGAHIDASAPHGAGGTWLLDPYDVDIVADTSARDFGTSSDATGVTFRPVSPTQSPSQLAVGQITGQLDDGVSVTVNTGTGGSESGTIRVRTDIMKSGDRDAALTLNAAGSIHLDSYTVPSGEFPIRVTPQIGVTKGPGNNGKLDVNLNANVNGTNPSALVTMNGMLVDGVPTHPGIATNGGKLTINGAASPGNAAGVRLTYANIDTTSAATDGGTGGDVIVRGIAPSGPGVSLQDTSITTATGAITIEGHGGVQYVAPDASGYDYVDATGSGVVLTGGRLSTTRGAIGVTGFGATGGPETLDGRAGRFQGDGVALSGGALVESTSGAVSIRGTAAKGKDAQVLVQGDGVNVAGSTIRAGGTLDLNGVGATADESLGRVGGAGVAIAGSTLTAGGAMTIDGTGAAAVQTISGVVGDGVSITGESSVGSTGGGITLRGTGASSTTKTLTDRGAIQGDGVLIDGPSISSAGALAITGTGASARNEQPSDGGTGISASGNGVSIRNATITAGAFSVDGTAASTSGARTAAAGPVVSGVGDGAQIVNTTIDSTGALRIKGTGAQASGQQASVAGAGVYVEASTLTSRGGDVTLDGTGAAGLNRFVAGSGVDTLHFGGTYVSASDIGATVGNVSVFGVVPDASVAAGGVVVNGMNRDRNLGIHANGDVRIYGIGNVYSGVTLLGLGATVPASATVRGTVSSAAGSVDIRGATNAQSNTLYHGISLGAVNLQADGAGQTVSLTGSTPVDANAIGFANTNISAGLRGVIVVRADNAGGDFTVFDDQNASFYSPSGTVVFVPGKVGPGFEIVDDPARPINVWGGSGGFTVGPSILGAVSSSIDTIVIGSSSHTGQITVNACSGARCQSPAQTVRNNLTLQNEGAGSGGISLAAGLSVQTAQNGAYVPGTLTLASAGQVRQASQAITAGLVTLSGPGAVTLTNAANVFSALALVNSGNVAVTRAGNFSIVGNYGATPVTFASFDTATRTVTRIGSGGIVTPGGNVTATALAGPGGAGTGVITLSDPLVKTSAGGATLTLNAADTVSIANDITSSGGPLDVRADAGTRILVYGERGDGPPARVRIATNGGSVALGTQGGAYDVVQSADIDTRRGGAAGGDVTIHGVAPSAPYEGLAQYAVDLNDVKIDSGTGAIEVDGRGANGSNYGGGVMLRNAGNPASVLPAATRLTSSAVDDASGGAIRIRGAANSGGGVAMLNGAALVAPNGTVDVRGSATGANAAAYGVRLDSASASGRAVALTGTGGTAGAGGVSLQAARLTASGGALRVYGGGRGAGAYGVALLDGSSLSSAGGPIDIRGNLTGVAAGAPSPSYGVLLLNGSINASAPAGTVSIAGSTSTADAGIAYGAVPLPANSGLVAGPFSITTGAGGVVSLRASNDGTATSLLGRSGAGSIGAPGGTLAIAPGSVASSDFAVTAQNGTPITLFGTNATPGLSIDDATYRTFSTQTNTLVLGSPTQTGRITVEGACAGGANCAARPAVATNLTLQNPGSGSQGIDLPSGIALPANATLALDTAGAATDPGGIQAHTLLLAGDGVFTLLDANQVDTLVLAGARTVNFRNAGSFTIGTGSANGIDVTGRVVPIGGQQGTVTGDLVAISDNGKITLGTQDTPMHLQAGGSIDLVMQSAPFDNPFGGTLSAGGAWRVWASTWRQENRNGIAPGGPMPNFYGCSYSGGCSWTDRPSRDVVSGNGNHFVYAERPTLDVVIGDQQRSAGADNAPFSVSIDGMRTGDLRDSVLTGAPRSDADRNSSPGTYGINGAYASPVGYVVNVKPGTLTVQPVDPPPTPLEGAVFNRTGLQPLFTAQEQSFVYESNLGGVNVCVGTSEPILAMQQSEGPADSLASEWKRVRSRPNLNNCLVVNGQHGCGEF
ncbi:hypothetical protein BYI23_D001510 (plasmid) [Burkholderia sp. YI23]|nr:hypothetical protein BYI23_D001510 [Burkholderia sp. YI23]